MCTPSTTARPPLEGNRAPVVNPSIWLMVRPASATAWAVVSMASAPRGTSVWRRMGLWA